MILPGPDGPVNAFPTYFAQSAFALALIYGAQGRDEEASHLVEAVISHTMETSDTFTVAIACDFQVELALQQGKVAEALRLSEGINFDLYPPIWFLYIPQLTPIKLLLAQNTTESLEKALILLYQLDGYFQKTNRRTIRIDALALQALILDAQGKEPAAFEKLSESLALAEPGGFIRNFVDMGPPMANLLGRLLKKNFAVDYIKKILAVFRDDEKVVLPEAADHPKSSIPDFVILLLDNRVCEA